MEGIVLSHLDTFLKNPDAVSSGRSDTQWNVMEYEAGGICGKCLYATQKGHPADITLVPNLKGWHKVFVASWRIDNGFSLHLKLDSDPMFTLINDSSMPAQGQWKKYEWVEEHFWCCADLTDRKITLRKHIDSEWVAPLVWIRCVPMTEEEVAEYRDYTNADGRRNLHVHFDNDAARTYGTRTLEDALLKLYAVKDTDAKICTHEIFDDVYDTVAYDKAPAPLLGWTYDFSEAQRKTAENINSVVKARLDLMHSMGVKLYAGLRTCVASAVTPVSDVMQLSFVNEHPEYYCKTREGRSVAVCSYAYPEVRSFTVQRIKTAVARGYDGVTLIMHRGIHVAFEQPVLDAFASRFDGLDARRVPMDDPRLNGIWCEYVTEFVRELRKELDSSFIRHVPINIITDYDPDTAKRVGVDVETLAREGLIDSVCADNMELYELVGDCLSEDGLIDLEKYAEKSKQQYTVRRFFGESLEKVKAGYPKYLAIAEKYGVEFFGGFTPVKKTNAAEYIRWADELRALGVKNFSMYNFCHCAQDKPVLHAIGRTGHEAVNMDYCTPHFYRVLSMDGYDISDYQPNWIC